MQDNLRRRNLAPASSLTPKARKQSGRGLQRHSFDKFHNADQMVEMFVTHYGVSWKLHSARFVKRGLLVKYVRIYNAPRN